MNIRSPADAEMDRYVENGHDASPDFSEVLLDDAGPELALFLRAGRTGIFNGLGEAAVEGAGLDLKFLLSQHWHALTRPNTGVTGPKQPYSTS